MERLHRTRASSIEAAVAALAVLAALGGFPAGAQAAFSLADIADDGIPTATPGSSTSDDTWDVVGALGECLSNNEDASELGLAIEVGQLVTYEAAGVAIELPEPVSVLELPGVFVMGAYDDFFVSLTQAAHDFAHTGGEQAVEEFLADCEAQGLATFTFETAGGGQGFGCTIEDGSLVSMDVYVPTASGDLANLWIEYPTDQGDAYIAASALVFDSLRVVDAPAVAAEARAPQETIAAEGVSFAALDLAWDDAVEGWLSPADELLFVYTVGDYFYGATNLTPDDLAACASELVGSEGVELASAVLVNPQGDHAYVYAALESDELMEVYAFVPLPDGTVTLVAALCEAASPEVAHNLAVVLHSLAVTPDDGDDDLSTRGVFGGLLERRGAEKASSAVLDLLKNPEFVAGSKMA